MKRGLYIITTKSLTNGETIYYRNVRGNKCRWTNDLNKAFVFATPQSAAYHIKLRQLKYVNIYPVERKTTLIEESQPIDKAMRRVAWLMRKWS